MLLLFLPLTMIFDPNLTDTHWNAFWDVNAVLPWDPLEIAKEPDEDWANSSGLAGLIAMESNYKAAPGDMVDHSQCSSFYFVRNDFCFVFTHFNLTWLYHPFLLSLNLSQKMEAFCFLIPKKIQVIMWSILHSKGIENQFGLIREWQYFDGTLGRVLPTLPRLWRQEGWYIILEMIFQGLCQESINNNGNNEYHHEVEEDSDFRKLIEQVT